MKAAEPTSRTVAGRYGPTYYDAVIVTKHSGMPFCPRNGSRSQLAISDQSSFYRSLFLRRHTALVAEVG